jgi:hypothetical protein
MYITNVSVSLSSKHIFIIYYFKKLRLLVSLAIGSYNKLLYREMIVRKILIPLFILGLTSTICLAGQSLQTETKSTDEHRSYHAFKLNYVKGILEETACSVLSAEIDPPKIVSENEQLYILSFLSIRSPFHLSARPPPL